MAALSRKLRSAEGGRLMFWCPGCDGPHQVGVGEGAGPRWGYNGNPDEPTVTPSILVRGTRDLTDEEPTDIMLGKVNAVELERLICQSFVTKDHIRNRQRVV